MPPETVTEKGDRLLVAGQVTIQDVTTLPEPRRCGRVNVLATVEGETGRYVVRHDARAGWACTCPATTRCSHLAAVQRVIDTDPPMPAPARAARWQPVTEPLS